MLMILLWVTVIKSADSQADNWELMASNLFFKTNAILPIIVDNRK